MESKITKKKLEKYFKLTSKALKMTKGNIAKEKENEAQIIIDMVSNYLSDAKHFYSNGDFVNSFAALNYSHGWLDAGARLGIFDVKDNELFTIK